MSYPVPLCVVLGGIFLADVGTHDNNQEEVEDGEAGQHSDPSYAICRMKETVRRNQESERLNMIPVRWKS